MQLQTFEGYLENERFFPIGKPIKKSGKQRVLYAVKKCGRLLIGIDLERMGLHGVRSISPRWWIMR